jgi:hypothetical protein
MNGDVEQEAMTVFFSIPKKPLAGDALDNPFPEWLPNNIYWAVLQLSKVPSIDR